MVDNFHKPHKNVRLREFCGYSSCLFLDITTTGRIIAQGFFFHGLVRRFWSSSSRPVLRLMTEYSFLSGAI